MRPNAQIDQRIAGIVELSFAQLGDYGVELRATRQVNLPIRCEYTFEDPQVIGHLLGEPPVRGCRQVQRSTIGMFDAKKIQECRIVWQGRWINLRELGNLLFKVALPLCEPDRQFEDGQRVPF